MKHIKSRLGAWNYFFKGEISLLYALDSMLPISWRFYPNVYLHHDIAILNQYHVELIKQNAVVVDAGANEGAFAIFAAQTHPDCMVYAFEPTPSTFRKLSRCIKKYPNIKCFNCGLGDKNESASIIEVPTNNGANHIGDGGTPCEIKTIDSLGIQMDFLKMDTEGYEGQILKGAAETIKKWKPIIAMSAYHKPGDKEELPRILNAIVPYHCELRHDGEEDFICTPN